MKTYLCSCAAGLFSLMRRKMAKDMFARPDLDGSMYVLTASDGRTSCSAVIFYPVGTCRP